MRAPLTVVIPTLNAGETLPRCLGALWEGMQAGLIGELIVVDGGSTDATVQFADDAGATLLTAPPSRGGQLRAGAMAARGEWFLFLHADTILPEGWSEAVIGHLPSRRAACFRLSFDGGGWAGRCVAGWANLRSRLFGLPYGDQALLLPRRIYERAGGFPDIPLMEDVALVRRLDQRPVLLPATVITRAERYQAEGWLWRGARNLWTLARYFAGVSPERLSKSYRKSS
ncbi:TIGR04283 family arsenosugar biosynthesis glycosyltransferase [Shimia biformata]|uniref:TIGR04283 family arsenosugar biosynthesis glycosyltransferase n=1 Tax=Shimia biformata TaxID=1294299 RepID=UPI001950EBBB|nr:TIGR04283 family arsenosugar biosynthesis glycosyltransferase [Shimia biformata]